VRVRTVVCSKVCFLVDALIWTVSLIRSFDILCLHVGDAVQLLVESCESRHPIRHTVVTLFVSFVLASYVAVTTPDTRTTETKRVTTV
jgi:hypothetical protein